MRSRHGAQLAFLVLVGMALTVGGGEPRWGLAPVTTQAQRANAAVETAPTPPETAPPGLAPDAKLVFYAERLVHILRAERTRLAEWAKRLADRERLVTLQREHEAARAQHATLWREVETLKRVLEARREVKLPVPPETLEVHVSVQRPSATTQLLAGPSPSSAVLKHIPPGQPIVVIAAVRGTEWRLVHAAGDYGFVSSAGWQAR